MSPANYLTKTPDYKFPDPDGLRLGRLPAVAAHDGAVVAAIQTERAGRLGLVVREFRGDRVTEQTLAAGALVHQPALAAAADGVWVVWNEATDTGWAVRAQRLGDATAETVHVGPGVCWEPVVTVAGGPVVAWSGHDGRHYRIFTSRRDAAGWTPPRALSAADRDAFRPSLAPGFATWDEYVDGTYQVVLAALDGATRWTGRRPGSRWFCPRVVAAGPIAYLAWVDLAEVVDPDRGIIDHAAAIRAGRWRGGAFAELPGDGPDGAAADLREGLLARTCYKGYLGRRRNPYLALDAAGCPWLLWESRVEAEATAMTGYLLGRRLDAADHWGPPRELAHEGYSYAVGPSLAAAWLVYDRIDTDIVQARRLAPTAAPEHHREPDAFGHWQATVVEPPTAPRPSITVGDTRYHLYWADTHCHSRLSGDAEGEPDELIHFARDVAGLDAVCIIDNDFYAHKALTEPEWRLHNANATHFTEPGRFVVLPGYEFTYHRPDLDPNFNHRCVIYPRAGGRLCRRIDRATLTDRALMAALAGSPAMCYPHHCTYDLLEPALEWNVEVCSSWRVCLAETDFTIRQLQAGHRLGFIGSSDTHRAVPGLGGALTGIYAAELTPEALFDAYRHRRLIATQGCRVTIDLRVNGAVVGSEVTVTGPPTITAEVIAPAPIARVCLRRDGEPWQTHTPHAAIWAEEFIDTTAGPGRHVYFLELQLAGDPSLNCPGDPATNFRGAFTLASRYPHNLARAHGVHAWSSPIWLDLRG